MKNKRWNWQNWLAIVRDRVPTATTVAEAIYALLRDKPAKKRGLYVHELGIAWGTEQSATNEEFHKLSRSGLLSRCPGMPYYAPTMKMDPLNADFPKVSCTKL
jgi:hypothetical protein